MERHYNEVGIRKYHNLNLVILNSVESNILHQAMNTEKFPLLKFPTAD